MLRRRLSPRTACSLLLVLAVLQASLGVLVGLSDGGDYSLVWLATPFMVLTAAAALAALSRRRWLAPVPVVLTSTCVALAVLMLSAYGIGLFHLPQSVLALGVALARESR